MSELTKRVLVAAIGIPVAVGIVYLGGFVFFLVVVCFSNLALWEFYSLFSGSNLKPAGTFGLIVSTLLQTLFYLLLQTKVNIDPLDVSIIFCLVLLATPALLVFVQVWSKRSNTTQNTAVTVLGIYWLGISFLSLLTIRFLPEFIHFLRNFGQINEAHLIFGINYPIDNNWAIKLFIVILGSIWICDSFAYFIGKAYGKHKLAPKVSPKKTWEGAIAGYVGAILGFLVLTILFNLDLPLGFQFLFASVIGIIGQIGDLAESKIKREFNVKDSSALFPGHGGVLDRFDSILFVYSTITLIIVLLAISG
jgi:phosphatidate cytidylyltransferase